MGRAIINDSGHFDERLLSCIKDRKNTQAISMIKDVRLRHLIDNSGKTLLHFAAEYNNSAVAHYLIDKGCNVDVTDINQNTPLMTAVENHNEQVVEVLLGAGFKIGNFHPEGKDVMTAPMVSKSAVDLKILEMLFNKITNGYSNNKAVAMKLLKINCPFPAVIFLRNAELTKLMLDLGCSIDERLFVTGETALHIAVRLLDTHNVNVLVKGGADLNLRDYKNRTPLYRFEMRSEDDDGKLEVLKILLDRDKSFNENFWIREIEVRHLLTNGDDRTLRVLMPYIDLFRTNDRNQTPVDYIVENKNRGVVDFLRDQKFNINARDIYGWSLLDNAAYELNGDMVQFLLENGANLDYIDDDGMTRLNHQLIMEIEFGCRIQNKRIIELLLQYGANAQNLDIMDTPVFNCAVEPEFAEPVLAHLAMIESKGELLNNAVYAEIKSLKWFDDYFESRKLQNEEMKKIVMCQSVTLHSLLFKRERRIIEKYVLNSEFLLNYELYVTNNKYNLDSYYISTLELRVGKTINFVQMKKKAAGAVCEIIELPSSMNRTIGFKIVEYLHYKDLENVLLI